MATTSPPIPEDQDQIQRKKSRNRIEWIYKLVVAAATVAIPSYFYHQHTFGDIPAPGLVCLSLTASFFPLSFLPITGLIKPSPTSAKRLNDLLKRILQFKEGITSTDSANSGLRTERLYFSNDSVKYLLACVDKFVDEAQGILSTRAHTYYIFGTCSITAAVGTLTYIAVLAYQALDKATLLLHPIQNPTHFVIMRIFGALAFAAAAYAIVKTLISYGSSFFHEGTRLLDRRHALRFGRLYMYMKGEHYDFEELEEAFQWHMESQTIFQGISPSKITDSTINQLLKTVSETAGAVAKVKSKSSED